MTVIDKRGKPLTVTFGDLGIGDVFQDNEDRICIKVNHAYAIALYQGSVNEWQNIRCDFDELIIPLKATLTIERGE
jgi:hypothetical protein